MTKSEFVSSDDLQLSIDPFFQKYKTSFGWMSETIEQYGRYIKLIDGVIGLIPFEELDEGTFKNATEAIRHKCKRKSGFSDATLRLMVSIFHDLCKFAEKNSDGQYFDVCENNLWRSGKPSQDGTRKSPKRITAMDGRERRMKDMRKATHLPRSLTVPQEQHLIAQLEKNYIRRGSYMALALMLYLGLRPSECLGLQFGDVKPLEGYNNIRCIYIYKQRKNDCQYNYSLKTRNAYRILPIPSELNALLLQRERGMRSRLVGDLSEYPIVCMDTKWIEPCKRKLARELCSGLLRHEFKNTADIRDLTEEVENDTFYEDKDITAYLLRRNFATAMVSICGMEEDELQYLMGHDIVDNQEKRSDLTDPDFIARMWNKMNRRILRGFPSPSSPIVSMDQAKNSVFSPSEINVNITPEDLARHKDKAVDLNLWNHLPGDYIEITIKKQISKDVCTLKCFPTYEPVREQPTPRLDISPHYCSIVRDARENANKHQSD